MCLGEENWKYEKKISQEKSKLYLKKESYNQILREKDRFEIDINKSEN